VCTSARWQSVLPCRGLFGLAESWNTTLQGTMTKTKPASDHDLAPPMETCGECEVGTRRVCYCLRRSRRTSGFRELAPSLIPPFSPHGELQPVHHLPDRARRLLSLRRPVPRREAGTAGTATRTSTRPRLAALAMWRGLVSRPTAHQLGSRQHPIRDPAADQSGVSVQLNLDSCRSSKVQKVVRSLLRSYSDFRIVV